MAKTAALQRHRPAAVFTRLGFGLRRGLSFLRGFIAGDFFRVLALGIGRAGHETAELAPLDDHRAAALVTDLVGWEFLTLEILHVLRSALQVLLELLVKLIERFDPGHLAVFDLIKLLFHARRVLDVEDVFKMFDEQFRYDRSKFGRLEFALVFGDVLSILDRGQNRRVCRWTSDAFLLERFHERGFGVSRRRLGEVLAWRHVDEAQLFALTERRQREVLFVIRFQSLAAVVIGGLFVNF